MNIKMKYGPHYYDMPLICDDCSNTGRGCVRTEKFSDPIPDGIWSCPKCNGTGRWKVAIRG